MCSNVRRDSSRYCPPNPLFKFAVSLRYMLRNCQQACNLCEKLKTQTVEALIVEANKAKNSNLGEP